MPARPPTSNGHAQTPNNKPLGTQGPTPASLRKYAEGLIFDESRPGPPGPPGRASTAPLAPNYREYPIPNSGPSQDLSKFTREEIKNILASDASKAAPILELPGSQPKTTDKLASEAGRPAEIAELPGLQPKFTEQLASEARPSTEIVELPGSQPKTKKSRRWFSCFK
ncbi:hypothetical protein MMC07_005875 [Pseudocyphellaria aurata]|nr:hypothetical protein [Pseudocyphellaria aurata]